MNFFQKIYYTFSQYANPQEKSVGKFFAKLSEKSNHHKINKKLHNYLQQDIITFTVFIEHQYKGYNYLASKKKRRQLYSNANLIVEDFVKFCQKTGQHDFTHDLARIGLKPNMSEHQAERLQYLYQIMTYLRPNRGLYSYRQSSTFGELLKDPSLHKLVGDCNQIVTFYINLYSLKYDISELKLITPPNHVALYFEGIQIEATNGQFVRPNPQSEIVPVQEIASINLLDTTDEYFQTHQVNPKSMLESSRLAYIVSSNRELVKKNLSSTYHNMVLDLVKKHDYKSALSFAEQSQKMDLIDYVSHNGAVYYLQKKHFKTAKQFAGKAIHKNQLLQNIDQNEASYLYNKGDYQNAIKIYSQLGNHEMVKNGYIALFAATQKRVGKSQTSEDIKRNKRYIMQMSEYAKKSGDKDLIKYTQDLRKYF